MTYHYEAVILLQLVCTGCGRTLVAHQTTRGVKVDVEPCNLCLDRRFLAAQQDEKEETSR